MDTKEIEEMLCKIKDIAKVRAKAEKTEETIKITIQAEFVITAKKERRTQCS